MDFDCGLCVVCVCLAVGDGYRDLNLILKEAYNGLLSSLTLSQTFVGKGFFLFFFFHQQKSATNQCGLESRRFK
jgi:hypothetical protein